MELLQQIASYFNDRTRRIMRLSSMIWFDIIGYNNFTCYFVRPQSLKQISERLILKYSHKNVGLTLLKINRESTESHIINSISVLTNLTSIYVDRKVSKDPHPASWLELATLTNLISFGLPVNYPTKVLQSLTRLTSLVVQRHQLLRDEELDVAKNLTLNSNIQSLTLLTRSQNQLDTFKAMANPSRLTRLKLDVARNYDLLPENEFSLSKLTNLRYLEYNEYKNTTERYISLTSLSSLEYLSLGATVVTRFDQNTNLTYLAIRSAPRNSGISRTDLKFTKIGTLIVEIATQQPRAQIFDSNDSTDRPRVVVLCR